MWLIVFHSCWCDGVVSHTIWCYCCFSWVQSFGHEGLGLLMDILEKLLLKKQLSYFCIHFLSVFTFWMSLHIFVIIICVNYCYFIPSIITEKESVCKALWITGTNRPGVCQCCLFTDKKRLTKRLNTKSYSVSKPSWTTRWIYFWTWFCHLSWSCKNISIKMWVLSLHFEKRTFLWRLIDEFLFSIVSSWPFISSLLLYCNMMVCGAI